METGRMLYEGKAKKLYETDDPGLLYLTYKDSLTAFNAKKKAEMAGKGELNNNISAWIFTYLKDRGVESHFIKRIDDLSQTVRPVTIVPLEVVVRNVTAGSICRRLGVPQGTPLPRPLVELYYKNDDLDDPLVLEDHALLFGWADEADLKKIKRLALQVNELLIELFSSLDIDLVDFKLEFGKDRDGRLILADEISPDTCRFWEKGTQNSLDKDRFREDLGDVLGAYREIWRRLSKRGR
ncbi:MAG: phosphoribosylaminoimidazolesuccinocarboxamide synthase [Dethiosulfovibrio peptidovorans]|nr:MAG: phosphoribosylaminoimidazolesuccinocarboxamide synthase [Dethiosulfovibrio peptidovorans]